MDGFGTIRLHHRTIKRFRRFSRKFKSSYSETLETILDFFEWHGISPHSRFASQINKGEERTRKRVEAAIAIIKDIEKTQTLPTNMMLQALFGQHEIVKKPKTPKLVEKSQVRLSRAEWHEKENSVSQEKFNDLKQTHRKQMDEVLELIAKIEFVKPRFKDPYWKIDTNATELAIMKKRLRR